MTRRKAYKEAIVREYNRRNLHKHLYEWHYFVCANARRKRVAVRVIKVWPLQRMCTRTRTPCVGASHLRARRLLSLLKTRLVLISTRRSGGPSRASSGS